MQYIYSSVYDESANIIYVCNREEDGISEIFMLFCCDGFAYLRNLLEYCYFLQIELFFHKPTQLQSNIRNCNRATT